MATLAVTDYPSQNQNSNSTIKCILILFLIGLIVVFAGYIYCDHATAKHATDAVAVRACMDNQGPIETWKQPNGRIANVCLVAPRTYGIMITEGKYEVTSYIKEKLNTLSDVRDYLQRMGAVRVKALIP